ncbi:hypothetical protein H6F75_00295 [Nodosilinea sp. FACHB-131]|uniref:hypothetical protein n=1 Tax=Cyanophyceae TaxID=3028117 RepID=UPI001686D75B|nr:hypothetical protein [Nodosilinea sp. FACHB-131]MBD1871909.1 hypothetical protein [Nodosilinea sp. FACHB-131]
MTNRPRLLSPYPGAKNPDRYPVHDGGDYDAWIAPFAGSGEQEAYVARIDNALPVIAADADPLVRSVWECWGDADLRQETKELLWQWRQWILADPETSFADLAKLSAWYVATPDVNRSIAHIAAVSIVLRRLTFGGVIRLNGQGQLNVGLSQDKLRSFRKGWQFTWPQSPAALTVFDDYAKACDVPPWVESAIAIVDPPYCSGTTDAYAHADGHLSIALDCVERLMANPCVARIVCFNYWGEFAAGAVSGTEYPIVAAMERIGQRYGREVSFTHLGTLATMNKGPGKTAVHRLEGVWEIGGRRLYGDRAVPVPAMERVEQFTFI